MEASTKTQAKTPGALLTPSELQTLDRMSPTYRRARIAELLRDRGYQSSTGVVEARVEMATVAREGDDYLLTTIQHAGHAWRLRLSVPMTRGLARDVMAGMTKPELRNFLATAGLKFEICDLKGSAL